MKTNPERHTILLVDDLPTNNKLLDEILKIEYNILTTTKGSEAIELANIHMPDLILLDIIMPELDGYEVCKILKRAEKTKKIPIIFVSAKNEDEDETYGLELGAVDYIVKPFSPAIVKARVKTHLELKAHRDFLESQVDQFSNELVETNIALKESMVQIQEAQEKLILSEKMASLGRLVASATHEINTPLGISITETSFLKTKTQKICDLFKNGKMKRSSFNEFLAVTSEALQIILSNLNRSADLIRSLKVIAVDQCNEEKRPFRMKEYMDDILISLRPYIKNTHHQVTVHCEPHIEINTYPGIISQIITNLMMNALMHGLEGVENGKITIDVSMTDNDICIIFSDNGVGIEDAHLEKIFDPYFTTKLGQGGSGLGLNIVKNLIHQKLHGSIEVHTQKYKGTRFIITLPKQTPS